MKTLKSMLRHIVLFSILSTVFMGTAAFGQQTGGAPSISDRVTVLEGTLAGQTSQIAALQSAVTALQANSATLATTVAGLTTQITALQAAVAALEANSALKIVSRTQTFDCSAHPDACVRGESILSIVDCATGTHVLSGGVIAFKGTEAVLGVTPDLVLAWSTPAFDDSGQAVGWWGTAVFTSNVTTGSYTVVTHAICTGS